MASGLVQLPPRVRRDENRERRMGTGRTTTKRVFAINLSVPASSYAPFVDPLDESLRRKLCARVDHSGDGDAVVKASSPASSSRVQPPAEEAVQQPMDDHILSPPTADQEAASSATAEPEPHPEPQSPADALEQAESDCVDGAGQSREGIPTPFRRSMKLARTPKKVPTPMLTQRWTRCTHASTMAPAQPPPTSLGPTPLRTHAGPTLTSVVACRLCAGRQGRRCTG